MRTIEDLQDAINGYIRGQTAELRLPWEVHLAHFGGEQEPCLYPDHNTGKMRMGYNRQVVWEVRDANDVHVLAGNGLAPLSLSDSIIYEECLTELPEGTRSEFRDRLQRVVDAVNALGEPVGRASA